MEPTRFVGLGPDSIDKYRVADGLISMIMKMANGALTGTGRVAGWPQRYVWFDVTAGPAFHPSIDCEGTPPIAMRHLAKMKVETYAVFIEGWPATYQSLEHEMVARFGTPDGNYRLVRGDSVELAAGLLQQAPRSRLGGIIIDPNGEVDFDLLAQLVCLRGRKDYDLVVYASATTLKRARRARETANNGGDTRLLIDLLAPCHKKLWIIKKPSGGAQQWSWLVGTNWESMPAWRKAGFEPITTALGQQYLARLTYTDGERQHRLELD
jgi:hypothetical protein